MAILDVQPASLEFTFEANTELRATITLRNCLEHERVAFKVKTTNLNRCGFYQAHACAGWCARRARALARTHACHASGCLWARGRYAVKPTQGFVRPGTTRTLKVYLVPHPEYTDELRACKDRLAVQSVAVDDAGLAEEDITAPMFAVPGAEEARLRVCVVRRAAASRRWRGRAGAWAPGCTLHVHAALQGDNQAGATIVRRSVSTQPAASVQAVRNVCLRCMHASLSWAQRAAVLLEQQRC